MFYKKRLIKRIDRERIQILRQQEERRREGKPESRYLEGKLDSLTFLIVDIDERKI